MTDVVPPPDFPLPGDPSLEEIERVMKEEDWSFGKARQFLLIEAGDPRGTDAPDA
jgi:hypothetical protein